MYNPTALSTLIDQYMTIYNSTDGLQEREIALRATLKLICAEASKINFDADYADVIPGLNNLLSENKFLSTELGGM